MSFSNCIQHLYCRLSDRLTYWILVHSGRPLGGCHHRGKHHHLFRCCYQGQGVNRLPLFRRRQCRHDLLIRRILTIKDDKRP
ncbi:hypothetical protein DPMN_143633 [Dreissena polymorpha]|uniref:Uncharacterized protein n=1 Tax=Dreissena polymorpha TaxID=45954 RepID=A0A9D4GDX8_DREPO|nr:hypothetical protein DPMN_143633 [Dreissena polymorpha]